MQRRIAKSVVAVVIVAELAIVGTLLFDVHKKYTISNTAVVHEIERETLSWPEERAYEFYYDVKPNSNSANGVSVPAHITEDGLRDRFVYDTHKPTSTLRIITLGDSHTYGVAIDVEYIYPEVLEDLLNEKPLCEGVQHYEVINLGMHGYDARFSAERFRLAGVRYDPDVVLWYVTTNDFDEDKNELERRLFEDEQNGLEITVKRIKLHEQAIRDAYGFDSLEDYQLKGVGAVLEIFAGPVLMASGESMMFPSTVQKIRLMQEYWGDRLAFTWLFNQLEDEELIPNDYHPNEAGHRTIAEQFYNFLESKQEIVCT